LLVDGISIADIATIVHCSPDATQLIADVAIENYKPAWAN